MGAAARSVSIPIGFGFSLRFERPGVPRFRRMPARWQRPRHQLGCRGRLDLTCGRLRFTGGFGVPTSATFSKPQPVFCSKPQPVSCLLTYGFTLRFVGPEKAAKRGQTETGPSPNRFHIETGAYLPASFSQPSIACFLRFFDSL